MSVLRHPCQCQRVGVPPGPRDVRKDCSRSSVGLERRPAKAEAGGSSPLENAMTRLMCARSSVGSERLTTNQEVGGSSPSGRARMLVSLLSSAWIEHRIPTPRVVGSNPAADAISTKAGGLDRNTGGLPALDKDCRIVPVAQLDQSVALRRQRSQVRVLSGTPPFSLGRAFRNAATPLGPVTRTLSSAARVPH